MEQRRNFRLSHYIGSTTQRDSLARDCCEEPLHWLCQVSLAAASCRVDVTLSDGYLKQNEATQFVISYRPRSTINRRLPGRLTRENVLEEMYRHRGDIVGL
eukprot:scaffold11862_cov126-Skeletonema_dohrnii-CCMP3373.AAC.1